MISIDGSSYTGGEATIPLINSADLRDLALDANITVTGLPSPYIGWVDQNEDTDDVTLVIVDNSDTDGDGTPDWEEVVIGTDPADASSRMTTSLQSSESGLALTWSTVSGRSYNVEHSTDLKEWALYQEDISYVPGEDASIAIPMDASSAGEGFYRIEVQN
jgi:hypothetical protein